MKKVCSILLIAFLSLSVCLNVAAQEGSVKITENEHDMSLGVQKGLSMMIPEADEKTVIKAWEKLMKDNRFDKKSKITTSKNETVALNMMINGIPVDVYSQVFYQNDGVKFTSFFDMGELGFINKETMPDNYNKVEQFLQNFAYMTSKQVIKQQLDAEVKTLKSLEGEQRKLEKENKRFHKEIDEAKKRILSAEKGIEDNLKEQGLKTEELKLQEKRVKSVESKLTGF